VQNEIKKLKLCVLVAKMKKKTNAKVEVGKK